jgi:uncharacterized protein (UPF0548 family)
VFSLRSPSLEEFASQLAKAQALDFSYDAPFNSEMGLTHIQVPTGFVLDHTRSIIGRGTVDFDAAKQALRAWKHFDLGWVEVLNRDSKLKVGEVVAVKAHALGLWSVNFSRILYVIDEPDRFGYGYGTTPMHVERGEERFLLEYDPDRETVSYDLLAVSQPAHWLAKLVNPYTRMRQRMFASESHRCMRVQSKPNN